MKNEIEGRGERGKLQSDRLAHPAPDPIPDYRFADRARRREPDAGPAGVVAAQAEHCE
ncbi:MAG: hypothetical protein R2729_31770 [Bryobacteraceae bacterium]